MATNKKKPSSNDRQVSDVKRAWLKRRGISIDRGGKVLIDQDGKVLDGQHRLRAIIAAT